MNSWLAGALVIAGAWAFFVTSRIADSRNQSWAVSFAAIPLGLLMLCGISGAAWFVIHAL